MINDKQNVIVLMTIRARLMLIKAYKEQGCDDLALEKFERVKKELKLLKKEEKTDIIELKRAA